MSLAETIAGLIDAALQNVHTALPGVVEKYDRSTGLADVKPTLKLALGTALFDYPVISHVPILMPRAGGALIQLPIAAGDSVLLIFNERSIDEWLNKGGIVDPKDARKFDLTDAVAIPGFFPLTSPVTPSGAADSLILQNGNAVIELTAAGKIKIGNGSVELFALLDSLLGTLTSASTIAGGPFDPGTITSLTADKTSVDGIKG